MRDEKAIGMSSDMAKEAAKNIPKWDESTPYKPFGSHTKSNQEIAEEIMRTQTRMPISRIPRHVQYMVTYSPGHTTLETGAVADNSTMAQHITTALQNGLDVAAPKHFKAYYRMENGDWKPINPDRNDYSLLELQIKHLEKELMSAMAENGLLRDKIKLLQDQR